MLQPERKRVSSRKDLVQKFPKPGHLVLDKFSCTLSTAKAGLFLYKHRRLLRCEKDSRCMETSRAGLVEVWKLMLVRS